MDVLNNRVNRLAGMVGGKFAISVACEVSPSLVSKWVKRGRIDPRYNVRVARLIAKHAEAVAEADREAWTNSALSCLDKSDVCECCGQPISGRMSL